jgi:hypothetical protein
MNNAFSNIPEIIKILKTNGVGFVELYFRIRFSGFELLTNTDFYIRFSGFDLLTNTDFYKNNIEQLEIIFSDGKENLGILKSFSRLDLLCGIAQTDDGEIRATFGGEIIRKVDSEKVRKFVLVFIIHDNNTDIRIHSIQIKLCFDKLEDIYHKSGRCTISISH